MAGELNLLPFWVGVGGGEVGSCRGVAAFPADAEAAEICFAEFGFAAGAGVVGLGGGGTDAVDLVVDFAVLEAGS